MRTHFFAILVLATAAPVLADERPRLPPTPLQDDATLRDVTFVGSKHGWAVGDRGVVWKTGDGGVNWELVPVPTDAPLRSACFVTNFVGWVAGGHGLSHSTASTGMLLYTRDGGRSWTRLGEGQLPRLHAVRFFNPMNGVVVGTSTAENPSGVHRTTDGGKTWQPAASTRQESWVSAAFGSSSTGVLVGKHGRVALLAGEQLLASRVAPLGLRTVHAATLSRDDTGWVVGDRGLLLRTDSGSVSWAPPPTPLPAGLRELVDLQAVATRGDAVWIAGTPGSIVLHSPDGGRNWTRQPTGETAPIRSLHFVDDQIGVAVGAFGTILRTTNGGTTWQAVHGGERRAALLAVHAHAHRTSFRLFAVESADNGYRSAVHVVGRRDVGPAASQRTDLDRRLDEAVVDVGAAGASIGTHLPLDLPDLDTNAERLVAEWNQRTDGKLEDALVGRLALLFKTWRPSVVVIDDPPPNDEATRLVNEAVRAAVTRAADPTRDLAHRELAGLDPWRVRRVVSRLPTGSRGTVNLAAYDVLARSRTTIVAASSRAESLVLQSDRTATETESFRVAFDAAGLSGGGNSVVAGLVIGPGTAARRELVPLNGPLAERERRLAERQRNVHAYATRSFDDPRRSAAILAELRNVTHGLSDARSAELLLSLAREQRRRAQWEQAEATYVELVERFPGQPAGREAAVWLFQLWTSTETAWQRSRGKGAAAQRFVTNADALVQRLERSIQLARHVASGEGEPPSALGPDPWLVANRTAGLNETPKDSLVNGQTWGADWRAGNVIGWQKRAAWVASLLRDQSPETFRSPEIQFPLATLYRQRRAYGRADEIHRRFQRTANGSAWQRLAATEVWMLNPTALPPRDVVVCPRAAEPPELDGSLGDGCWANSKPVPLTHTSDPVGLEESEAAYALLAYDTRHLYVAASVPVDPRLPTELPSRNGRSHDADLSPFDRLTLLLDVDRDYTTWYDMRVDQRGFTRDACWEDRSWDPRWYVAAKREDARWFVEVAIPFEELVPTPPARGHVWGLGLTRTKPALAVESWTKPVAAEPRPESIGLLRFQ